MKILLTGATGLIGTSTARALFADGHELVVLGRKPGTISEKLGFPVEAHEWDSSTRPDLSRLGSIDAVIHLAGESIAEGRWTRAKKESVLRSREEGSRLLYDAVAALPEDARPTVAIAASAIGIYGDRGSEILTEESDDGTRSPNPGARFLAEVCSKWEAQTLRRIAGVRVVALRFGMVLSSEGGALAALLPLFRSGGGGPAGSGSQWMSWAHIADVVGVIRHALSQPNVVGAVNVVSPHPVTNREFTRALARAVRRPALLPAPGPALKLALGEKATLVLGSQRVLPAKLAGTGYRFSFPEIADALRDLCSTRRIDSFQWIDRPVSEVFRFFSDERNLERITPPWLQFQVLGKSDPEIRPGTLIEYRLRLHKLPLTWKSRIDVWEPGRKFRDTQVSGPYRRWEHTHLFQEARGGTVIRDEIRYELPLGALGETVAGAWVAGDVRRIFEFRRKTIEEIFGRRPTA